MNRRIVITGASSQIGQAIAKRLVEPGDHVILHANKNAEACPVFSDTSVSCQTIAADFSDPVQLAAFCQALSEVDILINAAACTYTDILPNLKEADIDSMLTVNIKALITICRHVLPAMMVKRHGVIVNISSVAAKRGNRGQSVYAGTKGFIESFTKALAAEYGSRGVRINAVAPGAIDAGNLKTLLAYAENEVRQSTAMKRLGIPEDVAALVAFLCSHDAAFIHGKCIGVDGGFSLGV